MAAEVVQPLMLPNYRIYEECYQLVTRIRGDPDQSINYLDFVHGSSAIGLIDRQPIWCDEENAYYRHTANFALVLKERLYTGDIPETMSPIFSLAPLHTVDRCTRRWQVVAKFIPGSEEFQNDIDIRLQCLDVQDGSSIRAAIRTDLYRGTEKIGDETPTNVNFGAMFSRHVIFTGARNWTPADDDFICTPEGYCDTLYTLLGSFCSKNCCDN